MRKQRSLNKKRQCLKAAERRPTERKGREKRGGARVWPSQPGIKGAQKETKRRGPCREKKQKTTLTYRILTSKCLDEGRFKNRPRTEKFTQQHHSGLSVAGL